MTASPSRSLCTVGRSQGQHGMAPMKNLANSATNPKAARRWFREMLWRAFPSASENDLARKAADVLEVSPRQVRNWLREENDASLRYVIAVLTIAGGEIIFAKIEGR